MSDQAVIERIRSAMADEVDGMGPRAETLERVLSSPPRRTLSLGWLMPALAVGVAAVVAVVAVTSLTHRAPASRGIATGVPVGARGLASRLAVLRRAQTSSDVLPRWAVRETESLTNQAKVVADLSRLVGSVNLGRSGRADVYLVVQRPPHFRLHFKRPKRPLLSPRLGDDASIAFVGRFREEAASGGPTVAAGGDELAATAHGLTADPSQISQLWGAVASIVPDGVKAVKWVFTPMGRDTGLSPITVRPKVRDNVAIGLVSPRLQVYLSSAVWYGAGGRVLQSFGAVTSARPSGRNFKQALQTSLHDPVAPSLLRHFRVLRMPGHSTLLDRRAVRSLIEPNPLDLNVSKARVVVVPGTGAKMWLIPGTQGLAALYISQSAGPVEVGTAGVPEGEMLMEGAARAGHRTIVGVVPDGNRTVRVPLPGGGVRTAPVVNNVYAIVVPSNARRLVIRNGAGHLLRLRI